ncbi:MAG: aldo/keto reductase [Candidatus Aminicenantes bacterium]|nr:aldo/keto reductase [Candidatus Aminicenantes bacterium]
MAETHRYSRRAFVKSTIGGLAGAPLAVRSLAAKDAGSDRAAAGRVGEERSPIVRPLGKAGLAAPIVGMGVMNADNPELVRRSFEMGIRHFDTAANYMRGRNEEMVGRVLKELAGRKDAVIATKVYVPHAQRNMTAEQAKAFYLKSAEDSLRRLQTEYVDVLYSHNISEKGWLTNPGVLEALQALKQQGKARAVGFSTHENMTEMIDLGADLGVYEVILTTFNYALAEDAAFFAAVRKAESRGIGLVAMKTQCQQGWYRDAIESADSAMYARYYAGTLMNSALLKWALRHPFVGCAVPGFTTFQQLEEDLPAAFDLDYTPEERTFLEDRRIKLAMEAVCRRCRTCESGCPNGADVAELVRVHMYAAAYGNFGHARQVLAEIPAGRGLDACRDCSTCLASCRGRVNIDRRINELKTIFA